MDGPRRTGWKEDNRLIRRPLPTETNFIIDTWIKSWRGRLMPIERAHVTHKQFLVPIEQVIRDADLWVYDAGPEGPADGWICVSKDKRIVFYGYTREGRRNRGVFSELLIHALDRGDFHGITFACPVSSHIRRWIYENGGQIASSLPWILCLGRKEE